MSHLIERLRPKERRGSKPRCHLLTHGPAVEVAERLSELARPFAVVSVDDCWMPQGFDHPEEAQLHRAPRLLDPAVSELLRLWWLADASRHAKSPNFDIASTCTIDGKRGLLLVVAKAHEEELNKEAAGRFIDADSTPDRRVSHEMIGVAIAEACAGLERATSLPCKITRDSHYQMANRFAWAWKLTQLGIPVVLVYLGFLNADEMVDKGRPFASHQDWENLVKAHSETLISVAMWNQRWDCDGQALVPLIRTIQQPLIG